MGGREREAGELEHVLFLVLYLPFINFFTLFRQTTLSKVMACLETWLAEIPSGTDEDDLEVPLTKFSSCFSCG